jgi:hypothetical protein
VQSAMAPFPKWRGAEAYVHDFSRCSSCRCTRPSCSPRHRRVAGLHPYKCIGGEEGVESRSCLAEEAPASSPRAHRIVRRVGPVARAVLTFALLGLGAARGKDYPPRSGPRCCPSEPTATPRRRRPSGAPDE